MSGKKTAGIVLMVAFAGAFIVWTLRVQMAVPSAMARMAVSGLLALGIFAAWRFLVWKRPQKKL
jgi:hypothetical protein